MEDLKLEVHFEQIHLLPQRHSCQINVAVKGKFPRCCIFNLDDNAINPEGGTRTYKHKRFETQTEAEMWGESMVNTITTLYEKYLFPKSYTVTVDNEGEITRKDICNE